MPSLDYPCVRTLGLTGLLVTFAEKMSEPANRAALSFRAAVVAADWPEVVETSTSLTSAFVRFDPLAGDPEALTGRLHSLLASRDWMAADLPAGRRLWRIPVTLEGDGAPQLEEAAKAAGVTPDQARAQIASARVRVLTIGFAPGQPYMGELPAHWNIPRQTSLNPRVPGGALVVAVRQLIIFAGPTPTGWRHIGQTAFRCFRPGSDDPTPLAIGDEVTFRQVSTQELEQITLDDPEGGGATVEGLA